MTHTQYFNFFFVKEVTTPGRKDFKFTNVRTAFNNFFGVFDLWVPARQPLIVKEAKKFPTARADLRLGYTGKAQTDIQKNVTALVF